MLVWDVEELFSALFPDQTQSVTILVVSAIMAVRLLEKKKTSGTLPTELLTTDENDGNHQIMTEVEPSLEASGYRT